MITAGATARPGLGGVARAGGAGLAGEGCPAALFSGFASMPASVRWASVIGVGAPVSGSKPAPVFGKAMTSRIDSTPDSSAESRSQPSAAPACGGGP